jgi:hypothetical protein
MSTGEIPLSLGVESRITASATIFHGVAAARGARTSARHHPHQYESFVNTASAATRARTAGPTSPLRTTVPSRSVRAGPLWIAVAMAWPLAA